jgi:hypothetical protein
MNVQDRPGDPGHPQNSSSLLDEVVGGDAPPSAAAAGEPGALSDDGKPLVPVTAWTSPEDCEALAKGLTQRASPAEWAFARMARLIQDFESKLDKDQEIGAKLVGSPGDGIFRIEDLGYWAPDMILFYGKNSFGKPVRLMQHYTQLNLMLSAEPKESDEEPPRRIGFALHERLEKAAAKGAPSPKPPAEAKDGSDETKDRAART